MRQMWTKLWQFVESEIHRPRALVAGFAILILFFAAVNSFVTEYLSKSIAGSVYLALLAVWTAFWLYHRYRLPRCKKDRVGIVLAIFAENEAEGRKVKNDLVVKVVNDIEVSGFGGVANVLVLQNHHAQNIRTEKDVRAANKKMQGHFWIWGYTRTRGGRTYLDLEGLVVHRPVGKNVSVGLGRDFRSALPKRIEFEESISFVASEMAGDMIAKVAQYIIGIAAYISGSPELAIKLHSALATSIASSSPVPPNLAAVGKKLPELLSNEHLMIATALVRQGKAGEAEVWLSKAQAIKADNYGAWLLKSLLDFSLRADVISSLKAIEMAERYAGARYEWKYSKAFLLLWSGQYSNALVICRSISRHDYPGEESTIEDVELFNRNLISTGQAKPEVYFWLGYLNYRKKANLALGLEYLEQFIHTATATMAPLLTKARPYVEEMKQRMEVK